MKNVTQTVHAQTKLIDNQATRNVSKSPFLLGLSAGILAVSMSSVVIAKETDTKLKTPDQVEEALSSLLDSRNAKVDSAVAAQVPTKTTLVQTAAEKKPAVDHSNKSVAELVLAGLAITGEAKNELASDTSAEQNEPAAEETPYVELANTEVTPPAEVAPPAQEPARDYAVDDITSVSELEASESVDVEKEEEDDALPALPAPVIAAQEKKAKEEAEALEAKKKAEALLAKQKAEEAEKMKAAEVKVAEVKVEETAHTAADEAKELTAPAVAITEQVESAVSSVESATEVAVENTVETVIEDTAEVVVEDTAEVVVEDTVEVVVEDTAEVAIEDTVEAIVEDTAEVVEQAETLELEETAASVAFDGNEMVIKEAVTAEPVIEDTVTEETVAEQVVAEAVIEATVVEEADVEVAETEISEATQTMATETAEAVQTTLTDQTDANVDVAIRAEGCPETFNDIAIPVNGKLCQIFAADYPASMILFVPQSPEEVVAYYLASSSDFIEPKTIKQRTMIKSSDNNTTLIISKDGVGTQVDILVKEPII